LLDQALTVASFLLLIPVYGDMLRAVDDECLRGMSSRFIVARRIHVPSNSVGEE
jgi:hypothetical protein